MTESSNQKSTEEDYANDTTELGDIAVALHQIQRAPIPTTTTKKIKPTTERNKIRYSTTIQPLVLTTKKLVKLKEAFERINPIINYDYYDDKQMSVLGQLPAHSKVLLHSNGVIECLDQGNFPHPVSCKKFISCAKMEEGKVLGWEYTCPIDLSFDPIGGMCNWSAGLGCND